ncbi:MAG TPA: hypothetical protein VGX48_22765 [Pyrinomonadaceae bacterium]|jgi:hypothetical protein|nr:hypothetical protein [Pyrinomonadaceae bacterium]
MNQSRRISLLAFGLGVLFVAAAGGQAEAQDTSASADARAEERLYELLEDAAARAQGLRLAENRVRLQTAAACLLWPRDEERARAIIKESMSTLAALVAGADRGDPQPAGQEQAYTILRFEIVRAVAARDAKLALTFLRETRQERPAVRLSQGARPADRETALELSLAAEFAAKDAREAARVAGESLKGGVVAELLGLLRKLAAADREAASALATDTARRIQSEDLSTDGDPVIVALGLLGMTRPASPDAAGSITIDEPTRRDLVNAVVAAATKTNAGRTSNAHILYNGLAAIIPEVERYAPAQAAAVRAKAEEFRRSLDPSTRAWQKYEELRRKGSAEALAEAAAKAPAEVGDDLYADAAFKALDGGDADRARQLLGNISDPHRRALKTKLLEQQLLERSLARGKLEDAAQRLPQGATAEERVAALLYLSALAGQRNDAGLARRFLSEALALAGGRVRNASQFFTQLQIAHAYSAADPARGFAILADLADQLNELLAAAAVVDGFGPDCFKEGELKPFAGNVWGELVRQFGEELAALAPQDFERALAVAQKFEKDEVRVFVSLRVAERMARAVESKKRGLLTRAPSGELDLEGGDRK